jgi:hypothetical protein
LKGARRIFQCEIIHGRLEGKLFEPSGRWSVLRDFFDPPPQHPQLGPCELRFGVSAERSLVSWARRTAPETPDTWGTVSITRGADAPQSGHAQGSAKRLIGCISSKTPHVLQEYS